MAADMFYDPQQTYYGGSQQALEQQRQQAAQQMGLAQNLGTAALGNGDQSNYNLGNAMGAQFARNGQDLIARSGLNGAQSFGVSTGPAMQAYQAFDPTAAINGASQVAQDQGMRNAMSFARGGPNAALNIRQALAMQAGNSLQAQQQAQQMALQAAAQKAQLGMQAGQLAVQSGAYGMQAGLQERARMQQLALAQAQMGLGANAQATSLAAQMGQFREALYSGRDQNVNTNQLQADQFNERQRMLASQQQAAFVGGIANTVGGIGASAMGSGGLLTNLAAGGG